MNIKNQQLNRVFGENELALRKHLNYSQAHVGRTSSVSQRTISNIESMGEAGSATLEMLERLSEYYNAPAWQLLMPGIPLDVEARRQMSEVMGIFLRSSSEARRQIVDDARRVWKAEALRQENEDLKKEKTLATVTSITKK